MSSSEIESESSDDNTEQSNNIELSGEILKNYNIICELGRGSFSIVWLALNISNNNFYALKVQDPTEYKAGKSEIQFVQNLPKNPNVFNNIVEAFVEIRGNKKYLCSSWELHCSNVDSILRKGPYKNGIPLHLVKKIMKQLTTAISILHKKFKVFHGDIKTDNILIKGVNMRDEFIIQKYMEMWKQYDGSNRNILHRDITKKVLDIYEDSGISKYSIASKYLEEMNISLGDFGTHCNENDSYDSPFGTRYYQAPEIVLMGKCSFPVDIWALGCTFYELLTGELLFDPIKDSKGTRDYYHLRLIAESCGDFPSNCVKKTKYGKNFFDKNYKLINYIKPEINRLERKLNENSVFVGLCDDDKQSVCGFLSVMLQIDTTKRYSAETLCQHEFLA
jgi:serine/threonine-protein kinase SRPK3